MRWLNFFSSKEQKLLEEPREVTAISEELSNKRRFLVDALDVKRSLVSSLNTTLADPPDRYSSLWSDWNRMDARARAAEACSTVYACVQKYLMGAKAVRWVLRKRATPESNMWAEDVSHPVARTLRYPNPKMSLRRLLDRTLIDLLYDGNGYWKGVRNSSAGLYTQYWPIVPCYVEVVPDRREFIKEYRIHADQVRNGMGFRKLNSISTTKPDIVDTKDMVVFILESAESVYYGKGPVEVAKRVIEADSNALRWWSNQIRKGTRKEGILSYKHDPSADEIDADERLLRKDLLGPTAVGGILLLGQEHTYTPLNQKAVELDFSNSRDALRRECCAIFGMPPPMIGDFAVGGGYNSMNVARLVWWLDSMIPFLDVFKDTFNFHILNPQISPEEWDLYEFDYDLSGVDALVQIFGNRLDQALKMRKIGVPLNEIFTSLQIPVSRVAGGDVGYLEQNLIPLPDLRNRGMSTTRQTPSKPDQWLEEETIKDPQGEPSNPESSLPGGPSVVRDLQGQRLERRSL